MIYLIIYLLDRIEPITNFLQFSSIILLSVSFVLYLYIKMETVDYHFNDLDETNHYLTIIKRVFITGSILIFLTVLIPSEKSLYLMIGTYVAMESGIPQKVLKIVDNKLDTYIQQPDTHK